MRTHADLSTLVLTKLADTAGTTFLAAEVNYQIDESLKEISQTIPHLVHIPFKIESRYGDATATSASNLIDTTKVQFLTTDPAAEKVVYNVTDNTWATIISCSTTSTVGLSANIFASGESYRIFNKRCVNSKQIYIGDILPEVPKIESVEYPLGTKRNFKIVSAGVLEIEVDEVPDSNSTISPAADVDVLVRLERPQILSPMTDFLGVVSGTAGALAQTTLSVASLAASASIKQGMEFFVQTHMQAYTIAASAVASSAGVAAISFYPGLEAVAGTTLTVSFTQSTLKPDEEDILADLVAGRLMENKANKFIKTVSVGGSSTWRNYLEAGRIKVDDAKMRLRRVSTWKTSRSYPRE